MIQSYAARGDRVVLYFSCKTEPRPVSSITVGFDYDEALDLVRWNRRNTSDEWHGVGKSIVHSDDAFVLRINERSVVFRFFDESEIDAFINELSRHFPEADDEESSVF